MIIMKNYFLTKLFELYNLIITLFLSGLNSKKIYIGVCSPFHDMTELCMHFPDHFDANFTHWVVAVFLCYNYRVNHIYDIYRAEKDQSALPGDEKTIF